MKMGFFEPIWYGKSIGDGSDLDEAITAYLLVKPDNGNWEEACSVDGANPYIDHYSSFDDYLDNADSIESISVTSEMISEALDQLPIDNHI